MPIIVASNRNRTVAQQFANNAKFASRQLCHLPSVEYLIARFNDFQSRPCAKMDKIFRGGSCPRSRIDSSGFRRSANERTNERRILEPIIDK